MLNPSRCCCDVQVDSKDKDEKEEEEVDESSKFSLTDSESSDDESVKEGELIDEEHGIQPSGSDINNAEQDIPGKTSPTQFVHQSYKDIFQNLHKLLPNDDYMYIMKLDFNKIVAH